MISISVGDSHVLALQRDGTVRAWGNNYLNQCDVPKDLDKVFAIAAGYEHSLAIQMDGKVRVWGSKKNLH